MNSISGDGDGIKKKSFPFVRICVKKKYHMFFSPYESNISCYGHLAATAAVAAAAA